MFVVIFMNEKTDKNVKVRGKKNKLTAVRESSDELSLV